MAEYLIINSLRSPVGRCLLMPLRLLTLLWLQPYRPVAKVNLYIFNDEYLKIALDRFIFDSKGLTRTFTNEKSFSFSLN